MVSISCDHRSLHFLFSRSSTWQLPVTIYQYGDVVFLTPPQTLKLRPAHFEERSFFVLMFVLALFCAQCLHPALRLRA